MRLEAIEDSTGNTDAITQTFEEEILLLEGTTRPWIIVRGGIKIASALGLLKKLERDFEPHGHAVSESELLDARNVLGHVALSPTREDAATAGTMSAQIGEYMATNTQI